MSELNNCSKQSKRPPRTVGAETIRWWRLPVDQPPVLWCGAVIRLEAVQKPEHDAATDYCSSVISVLSQDSLLEISTT